MGKEIIATFDDDTKRMHRFIIDEGQDIKGTIYVSKEGQVPDVVTIRLLTKSEKGAVNGP